RPAPPADGRGPARSGARPRPRSPARRSPPSSPRTPPAAAPLRSTRSRTAPRAALPTTSVAGRLSASALVRPSSLVRDLRRPLADHRRGLAVLLEDGPWVRRPTGRPREQGRDGRVEPHARLARPIVLACGLRDAPGSRHDAFTPLRHEGRVVRQPIARHV